MPLCRLAMDDIIISALLASSTVKAGIRIIVGISCLLEAVNDARESVSVCGCISMALFVCVWLKPTVKTSLF